MTGCLREMPGPDETVDRRVTAMACGDRRRPSALECDYIVC